MADPRLPFYISEEEVVCNKDTNVRMVSQVRSDNGGFARWHRWIMFRQSPPKTEFAVRGKCCIVSQLRQPTQKFYQKIGRTFLSEVRRTYGNKLYFITAIYALTDAEVQEQPVKPFTTDNLLPGETTQQKLGFVCPGTRAFVVGYREVKFSYFRRGARLGSQTKWQSLVGCLKQRNGRFFNDLR